MDNLTAKRALKFGITSALALAALGMEVKVDAHKSFDVGITSASVGISVGMSEANAACGFGAGCAGGGGQCGFGAGCAGGGGQCGFGAGCAGS